MKQRACTWYLEVIQVFTLLRYTVSLADEAVLYKFGCDSFTIVGPDISAFGHFKEGGGGSTGP
jgi:hypothetical protein